MKTTFLCPPSVLKISVASYLWTVSHKAERCKRQNGAHVRLVHDLVDVVRHQGCVEQEGDDLEAEEEEEREGGVGEHLGEDELWISFATVQRYVSSGGLPG
jgi:hypothetical protein